MIRRQLITSLVVMVVMTVALGLLYPFSVWAVAQVAFHDKANDSLVKVNGKAVGSKLLGQNFTDKDGNPLPQYFQPRPSAAGTDGYDASASSASNLGPTNPKLIGNIPGVAIGSDGKPLTSNPYATKDDPYCVPVQATDKNGNDITDAQGNPVYEKNKDGSYVCDPNTVPERVLAYRSLNNLPANTKVPVDAVTTSASGLDPDITIANADLQAARVAQARHLPLDQVMKLVHEHTQGRTLGFLGEKGVNVLELNLALDKLGH
jgi:K+-transporting ATPase ATPase C chain